MWDTPHRKKPGKSADTPGVAPLTSACRRNESSMTPLTLVSDQTEIPRDFPALLDALASRPQPAVVWRDAEGSRVELSGRVLQNWAIKLIGFFTDETDLQAGDRVLVDTAPHWKASAVALALSSLGAEVTLRSSADPAGLPEQSDQAGPALIITDAPREWAESDALGEAELAALSPGLLDSSFDDSDGGSPLPAWILDISAEVRQHPDQLVSPLEPLPLPSPETSTENAQTESHGTDSAGTDSTGTDELESRKGLVLASVLPSSDGSGRPGPGQGKWTGWDLAVWDTSALPWLYACWARGGAALLYSGTAGRSQAWDQMLSDEGVR